MIDYTTPPFGTSGMCALPGLAGVKNGDYLRPERFHRTLAYSGGQKLRDLLAGRAEEPCALERNQMTAELLGSPRKLRKGMEPR